MRGRRGRAVADEPRFRKTLRDKETRGVLDIGRIALEPDVRKLARGVSGGLAVVEA